VCRVYGLWFMVYGFWFRVYGSGFRVRGLGFRGMNATNLPRALVFSF
jgi:hypothetical protein